MRRIALLLIAALWLAACATTELDVSPSSTTVSTTPPSESAAAALASARSRWAASAPADYTLSYADSCDGCAEQTLAVRSGEVVSLSSPQMTVEELFATIEESLRRGSVVEVEYHPELGHPTRLVVDLDGDGEIDLDLRLGDPRAMPVVESLDELREFRRIWEAQNLDHYRYLMRADCTCPEGGTFDVIVRDGRVDEVLPLDELAEDSPLSPTTMDRTFDDLEEWFTGTEDLIDEGILDVEVRMDPELGYPRWVRIDADSLDADGFDGAFTIIVTLDVIGPVEPVVDEPSIDDLEVWQEAADRWRAMHPTDYSFTITHHCECPAERTGPFQVTVLDGRFAEAVRMVDGVSVDAAEMPAATVDAAFELIRVWIDLGTDVDVTYDEVLGYPTLVLIDPEAVAVDGGLAFSIIGVEPLSAPEPPEAVGVVAGVALAGPQCPVETDPPRPECADQPVASAEIHITTEPGTKPMVVVTGEDGTFSVELAPGTYLFTPQPYEGLLGTPAPFEVVVPAGAWLDVLVPYDTGIR